AASSGATAAAGSGRTVSYPWSRTTARRAAGSVAAGSKATVARPVAKLTPAWATPGAAPSAFSMRAAQAAQCIPRTGTSSVAGRSIVVGMAGPSGGGRLLEELGEGGLDLGQELLPGQRPGAVVLAATPVPDDARLQVPGQQLDPEAV